MPEVVRTHPPIATLSRVRTLVVPIAWLFALSVGCGADTSSPVRACVPGVTQSCLCVGGGTGVQSCKDDGTKFGVCACGGADAGVDASADTTVESDGTTDTTTDAPTDLGTDVGIDTADAGGGSTFSESFSGGVAPTTQCASWDAFRKSLSASKVYSKITVKGSLDAIGVSCSEPGISGPRADAICQALRTGTAIGMPCGSNSWSVSVGCGGAGVISLVVNLGGCACETGFSIHPCSTSANWGGIGATCGAPSQTLTVICE